ncbi:hypothetical protein CARUB_v10015420mg [Capsella rubella]|uniref:Phorbol-ester/DAG-type domain-containing protein n=1 Tax=Capsella rubella TaxID=81985 RepID=R0HQV2_9BRAS|nr:hypothetical protein CARUB_v10015420mg [Capsella rubella]
MDQNLAQRCCLSDPAHPHALRRQDNPRPSECFSCGPLGGSDDNWNDWHYYCDICKLVFHEGCEIFPLRLRHPYHPTHLLYTTLRFSETNILSFEGNTPLMVYSLASMLDQNVVYESNNACDWCGENLGSIFYRCIECDFRLDMDCMREDPPFTITDSESHQHPLTLFARQLVDTCSACGLGGKKELGYACEPCNYFVHKKCIVLRTTCHRSNTSSKPSC